MDSAAKRTDEALLASALNGDEQSWNELVDRYDLWAVNYTFSQVSDYDLARDTVQEHWTILVRRVSVKPPECFGAFFWTLLRRRIADGIRKTKRNREFATLHASVNNEDPAETARIEQQADSLPDPLDIVLRDEEQDLIQRALAGLPVNYQATIEARLFEERSIEETARILISKGIIPGGGDVTKTVYNLCFLSRKAFVKRLLELGFDRGR